MRDQLRSFSRYPKNWSEGINTRPSQIWKNDFISFHRFLSKSLLHPLSRPIMWLPRSQHNSVSTFGKKVHIFEFWNSSRYWICGRIILLPQFRYRSKAAMYSQTSFTLPKKIWAAYAFYKKEIKQAIDLTKEMEN